MERNVTPSRLKEALLEELLNRVENGEKAMTKDGEIETLPCPASTLNVALGFLKQFPPDELPTAKKLSPILGGPNGSQAPSGRSVG